MASRASTPSEGEIVESGSEKANKSQSSAKDISVDRHTRKRYSISRSPSPVLSPKLPGNQTRSRSRSRSRSPYRESRGSKRLHEEDHYGKRERGDTRSFRVRYENDRYDERDRQRPPPRGPDRRAGTAARSRYDSRDSGRLEKRPRTVSRSPPRFSGNRSAYDRKEHGRNGSRNGAARGNLDHRSKGRTSIEQSVSDRGLTPVAAASSGAQTEPKLFQVQRDGSTKLGNERAADKAPTAVVAGGKEGSGTMETAPVDEATLIEQRRKRREAILAKHRGQAVPLLVQALNIGTDSMPSSYRADTPGSVVQPLDSPKVSPPQTPKHDTQPQSPSAFDFEKDSDLANDNVQANGDFQEDGPSAADYDPTLDMQEDKLRYDSKAQAEVPPEVYGETCTMTQDVLIPQTTVEKPGPRQSRDDFDMFADEMEEDMFAEAPVALVRREVGDDDVARTMPVPRAKALDASMLDDWDDDEGYYKVILGELLEGRYHVQANLGKGMFSAVVRAMDQNTKRLVAIKIIRNNETMKKAAAKEIDILHKLNQADPEDKKHLIRLERDFEHKGHLCIVFENLSINLREVLKKFGRDVGINLKAVRAYAQQMFLGLSLLRKCNILHADLKPDNVLVNESRNLLKICDLGSASDASENEITPYLVSRFYRAPEIILGMPYDFAIDTWSIGCTLFELYTGKILFTGRTNNQMLRSIMECRGRFSHKILRKAEFAGLHFDDLLNFRSVEQDKLSGKDVVRVLNFTKPTRDLRTRLVANAKGMAETETKELNLFMDLLDRCLNLNPERRCTPSEALKHPFILRAKA